MQAPGRNSCVETIEFEYGFLIILPKTREAKNYKLEIFLVSGVGLEDRLSKLHADRTEMLIMRSMGRVTGRIDVDYIDLAVGRNIESQVDEWFLSLAKIGPNWFSKFTLAISDNLTIITRFLFLSVLSVAGIWYLSPLIIDMRSLFLGLSAIIVFGIFLNSLAFSVSASFEQKFKRFSPKSLIELSDCDRRTDSANGGSKIAAWGGFLAATIFTSVVGLALTYATRFLIGE